MRCGGRCSPVALGAFELVFRPWMRRRIRRVLLAGMEPDLGAGSPLLLVANHSSWWDAFLLRELQRILRPGAPVLTVMLESELARFPFFSLLGAIGLDPRAPGSIRRVIRTLQGELRREAESVVLFFPQGRIWPSHRRPLGFRRGIELFARELAPVTLLPVGIHLEPLGFPAPTAFLSVGDEVRVMTRPVNARALEEAVEGQLDRILAFLAREGERATEHWPSAGASLPWTSASGSLALTHRQ